MRSLRVGASVGHGEQTRLVVLELEVLISELVAVDGLATGALETNQYDEQQIFFGGRGRTLPRVKSPPWSMNSGMIRWKLEPL